MLAITGLRPTVSRGGWLLLAFGFATLLLVPACAKKALAPAARELGASTDNLGAGAESEDFNPGALNDGPKCYVTGSVLEEDTHAPVPGVEIEVLIDSEQEMDKRVLASTSDAAGRYRIEVPLGSVRVLPPQLRPGYWSGEPRVIASLVTTAEEPVAVHNVPIKTGVAWFVRLAIDGDMPESDKVNISVTEALGNSSSTLATDGTGGFTQCGDSGRLVIQLSGEPIQAISAELIVEPLFDITKVKSIEPVAGTDKTAIVDGAGAKATIENAEVILENGSPLLVFHAVHRPPAAIQRFAGQIIDAAGNPLEGARIGLVHEFGEAGCDTGIFVKSDKYGRFAFSETLPRGEADEKSAFGLVITKDGYAGFDTPTINFPKKPSPVIDVGQLTLRPGHSLPVRVVDANGKGLAGAVIEPMGTYAQRRQAARTDGQGIGLLRNMPSGVVEVTAQYGAKFKQTKLDFGSSSGKHPEAMIRIDSSAPQRATIREPIAVGREAPEWSLAGWSDGKDRKLSDYQGKFVLLDFWATGCGVCVATVPAKQRLAQKYEKRGIVFLAIHAADGETMDEIKRLQEAKGWATPSAIDHRLGTTDGATFKRYAVTGLPTAILIAPDGKIVYNGNGPEDVETVIDKLLFAAGR